MEKELVDTLKTIDINKTPGNDRLTKEFYEALQEDLKKHIQLINSWERVPDLFWIFLKSLIN